MNISSCARISHLNCNLFILLPSHLVEEKSYIKSFVFEVELALPITRCGILLHLNTSHDLVVTNGGDLPETRLSNTK